jgi:prolyl 4-hydroxylase
MRILSLSAIFLILSLSHLVHGEIFTALADMEGLVQTELEIVRHLENYISTEEARISRLKG